MRLAFVVGTPAELIKIYPLIVEANERKFSWRIVSTGQQPVGLAQQFADFDLDAERLIRANERSEDLSGALATLKWLVGAWLARPKKIIPEEANVIIVQGDSLSTLVGARWGRRLGLPVVHVEAGLRSGQLRAPFPEEWVRRSVAHRASVQMAPDDPAAENLRNLGYDEGLFSTGGNTAADSVRLTLQKHPLNGKQDPYVVAHLHRFENLNSGARWHFLLQTMAKISKHRKILFIMHPRTRRKLENDIQLTQKLVGAGVVIEPRLPYSRFLPLVAQAEFVLTDGGSIQEECYYLGVPCLILRDASERSEGLQSNCALAKFDDEIVDDFIADPKRWRRPPSTPNWSPSGLIMDSLVRALTSLP